MKKLFLFMLISIISFQVQSQTDLEIADAIIGKSYSELTNLLTNLNLEYYITSDKENNTTMYISKNNSVRLWELKHEDLYRDRIIGGETTPVIAGYDLIVEIFVRYKHSNINDLREFHAYELPKDIKFRDYEKSLGDKLSHFRVTQE